MTDTEALRPLLSRYPDARRGSAPLFDPILFPYVALIFGFGAALLGLYNAWNLRRLRLALLTILISLLGVLLFMGILIVRTNIGIENAAVAVIIGRAIHFILGGWLYFVHRPHFGGHQFKNGQTVPVLQSYVVAILLSMVMPWRLALLMLGGLFAR